MKIVILTAEDTVLAWHETWQQSVVLSLDAYAGLQIVKVRCALELGKPLPEDATPIVTRAAGAA